MITEDQYYLKPNLEKLKNDMGQVYFQLKQNLFTQVDSQTILKQLYADNFIQSIYDKLFKVFSNQHEFILKEIIRTGHNHLNKSEFLETYQYNINVLKSSILQILQFIMSDIQQKFVGGLEKALSSINYSSPSKLNTISPVSSNNTQNYSNQFSIFQKDQSSHEKKLKELEKIVQDCKVDPIQSAYQSPKIDYASKTIETTINYLQQNTNKYIKQIKQSPKKIETQEKSDNTLKGYLDSRLNIDGNSQKSKISKTGSSFRPEGKAPPNTFTFSKQKRSMPFDKIPIKSAQQIGYQNDPNFK